jgi:hypothetical protein
MPAQTQTTHIFVISSLALMAAGASLLPAVAGTERLTQVLPERQAFSQSLGSKQTVGYFEARNGRCQVTLMVAETFDEYTKQVPASAARIVATIEPSQATTVESAERQMLTITCGPGARTVVLEFAGRRVM